MRNIFCAFLLTVCAYSFGQNSVGVTKLGQLGYTNILNDIWGYADGSGNEYALVGLTTGLSIVDVTNPSNPVEKHFIPGVNSTWRDIKTWGSYAYVIHDSYSGNSGSDGILVVDLNTINSGTLDTFRFYPTVTIDTTTETYDRSHNIFVDEKGVLYVFGSNIGVGGALMFDVGTDPIDPPFLGAVNSVYYHDGVARGDTLWGAAIYSGVFHAINVSNQSNPVLYGMHGTPNSFTHNIWFSDDNQTVFTTDEKKGAFVAAYDVSDMNNITALDRIRTGIYNPQEVIPHNVHVKGDFLVTSYYTSGLQIVDASHPEILVETAYYDTSPFEGDGFKGAWGAYPYLPSGIILVSDREEGLFILDSKYPRAAFFTAFIEERGTGNPVVNAQIEMLNTDISGTSNIFGNFRDGQRDTGAFDVVVSKPGYYTDTVSVNMQAGIVENYTIVLTPLGFSVDEDLFKKGINVFPNPSSKELHVEFSHTQRQFIKVEILDLAGNRLYVAKEDFATGKVTIEHDLKAGIYLFRIIGENMLVSRKFVVVR